MKDRELYRKSGKAVWAGMLVLAVLLLGACSDENESEKNMRQINLMLASPSFPEGTRALPDNFETYGTHYGPTALPQHAKILTYFASEGTAQPSVGEFDFTDSNDNPPKRSWSSYVQADDQGIYYLYGLLPRESMNNVNIAPYNGNYKNGAVLTINGISAITEDDLCVFVGLKGYDYDPGTDPNNPNPLPAIGELDMASRLGKFDINIIKNNVYAYLLVDHIFCLIDFDIKISERYSELRKIKIKQVRLRSYNANKQSLKTVSATVTLAANDVQRNPLLVDGTVRSVYINIDQTGYLDNPAWLYNDVDNPHELSTTAYSLKNFYAPAANQLFVIEALYDVYDRNNKLVRENQEASNQFQPSSMVSGFKYTYHITVGPTYLYSLSEKDLDNPTITVTP